MEFFVLPFLILFMQIATLFVLRSIRERHSEQSECAANSPDGEIYDEGAAASLDLLNDAKQNLWK